MSADKRKALTFLKKHGFNRDNINPDDVLKDFDHEMIEGLAGRSSSLAMIPTFITADQALPVGEPVIVMDAGGTNLRVATVTIGADGTAEMEDFSKHTMPGFEKEVSKAEFFEQLADHLMPVIEKSDSIGLCFSYPAEISPDRDGKLLTWTKEIKAPEIIGEFISVNILSLLSKRGHSPKIVLLNDTIATLLAGKSVGGSRGYGGYVGFILGTGTNAAYVESNRNITKRDDLDPGESQAINIESGNFAKAPRSKFDEMLDNATNTPGQYFLEKMTSGAYLGELCLTILGVACREGLLSESAAKLVGSWDSLTTKDMDDFVRDPSIEGPFRNDAITADDRELMILLFSEVVTRAALLAAVHVGAAAIKSGTGHDPEHPVCLNIDGSTYYKTQRYQSMAETHLKSILGSRGIHFETVHVDNSPIIGAAVAGLCNV